MFNWQALLRSIAAAAISGFGAGLASWHFGAPLKPALIGGVVSAIVSVGALFSNPGTTPAPKQ